MDGRREPTRLVMGPGQVELCSTQLGTIMVTHRARPLSWNRKGRGGRFRPPQAPGAPARDNGEAAPASPSCGSDPAALRAQMVGHGHQ